MRVQHRIKASERVAKARRRACAAELREAGVEEEVLPGRRIGEIEAQGTNK
jgi:hypothetical protein